MLWGPTLVAMATKFGLKSPITRFVPSNRFFFFVSPRNRASFWPSVLDVALYKTLFFDFWFRPPNPQNLLPKIWQKTPISPLVWQIDRNICTYHGVFRDGRFNETIPNVVVVDPCCHGNEIWAKIAYNSPCMADRPHMFAHTGGFRGWPIQCNHAKSCRADPCCYSNDICARRGVKSPTGLSICLSVRPSVTLVHCVHMVQPTIMISSPFGSPIILVSGHIKLIPKFEGGSPRARALSEGGVGMNWRFSTNKPLYLRNGARYDKGYY